MQKHSGIIFMFSILIITALACNLPSVTPAPPVDVDATFTSLALTQAGQSPPAGLPTFSLATPSLTLIPTITLTGTPSVPMVSVSVDTNCRTGPGVIYDYLTALLVGEKAEVIGKYTSVSPNYWVIKKNSVTCWLWGQYAIVEGNTSNLPEMIPPPSPTPTFTPTATATATPTGPNFTFSFEGLTQCSPGDDYATLKWVNTGSVAFESAKTEIKDLDTAGNLFGPSFSNTPFGAASPGCGAGNSNLAAGNTAYASYYIGTPAPTGHHIRIIVTLCSQDNVLGDCVTHSLDSVLP
jgi:hypothetical protein